MFSFLRDAFHSILNFFQMILNLVMTFVKAIVMVFQSIPQAISFIEGLSFVIPTTVFAAISAGLTVWVVLKLAGRKE